MEGKAGKERPRNCRREKYGKETKETKGKMRERNEIPGQRRKE